MSFKTIRHAQQAVWPRVRTSLERHRRSRDAVKSDKYASASARARARLPWEHVVANETVWALAHANLLQSEETAAVVTAAQAWVKTWHEDGLAPNSRDDDPADVALYSAVQNLATALVVPPDDAGL